MPQGFGLERTQYESTYMRRIKGKGWKGNSEAHQEAGAKGGVITAQRHGSEFYKMIGSKGGKNKKHV